MPCVVHGNEPERRLNVDYIAGSHNIVSPKVGTDSLIVATGEI